MKLQDALATPDGVQLVSPPSINKAGDAATVTAIPTTRPADPKTADMVTQMRTSVIPPATGGGVTAYVGGVTAANVDLAAKISSQLLQLILVVLALSIVLLLVAFRSLLIPVQAVVTNLLCVGAAFGVLVATFQWGRGLHLVGLSTPYGSAPIASYVPLMMFAALFGLSMDCEVFLVSQVAQHHDLGVRQLRPQRRPDDQAVRRRHLVAAGLAGPRAPPRRRRRRTGAADLGAGRRRGPRSRYAGGNPSASLKVGAWRVAAVPVSGGNGSSE